MTKDPDPEIARLREEYARRADDADSDDRYSSANPAFQWILATRQRAIIDFFERFGVFDFSKLRILEMGCGSGGVLEEFIDLGSEPVNMFGVDLLWDRLRVAKYKIENCSWVSADGQNLPFSAETFDLVLQFTAFSSILNLSTKATMAKEMMRVLKPGKGILWYDFIWNPLNRQTRGIPITQVRNLFPGMLITARRITLAPPISRTLIPEHQRLATALSRISFLNSHLLVWIQKPG
ncbi:MAG: class I SAM-dependent methyltransferase [Anaerolineaceae bacterium]|jgi:ubiquinone/menaquinone biosynthesis C-methylase UbiE